MLFHSQFFVLVFLPIAVIAYYSVASSPMLRQWVLIAASLAFYSWWDVRFIPLLVVQIGATWLLAILAERLQAKWPLIVGVVLNVCSLGTFKYLDFLIGIAETVSGVVLARSHIVLPIGISFFRFS